MSSPDQHAPALIGAPAQGDRIATLDGLRGLAVMMILVHHFVALSPLLDGAPGSWVSYVRAGLGLSSSGVDLFFVLSGFLVGGILLDQYRVPGSLKIFYARRALRILPLAWLHVALVLVLHRTIGPASTGEVSAPWWVYAGFVSNHYHAWRGAWELGLLTPHWSLAIEEQFYLLFPIVLWLWPRRALGWVGPALIASALATRIAICLWAPEHRFATHVLTPCRLDALGVGVLCAWLIRHPTWRRHAERRGRVALLLAILSLPLVFLLKNQYRAPEHMAIWGYTALALFYGALLLVVYQPREKWLLAVASHPILTTYGRYSYFIYLFQGMLGQGLVNLAVRGTWHSAEPLTAWQIALVPVLLLPPAMLSWRLLESPLVARGKRMAYRRAGQP